MIPIKKGCHCFILKRHFCFESTFKTEISLHQIQLLHKILFHSDLWTFPIISFFNQSLSSLKNCKEFNSFLFINLIFTCGKMGNKRNRRSRRLETPSPARNINNTHVETPNSGNEIFTNSNNNVQVGLGDGSSDNQLTEPIPNPKSAAKY